MTAQMKQRGVYERSRGSGIWWVRYADARGKIRREKVGTKTAASKLYSKRKTEALTGKKLPESLRSVVRIQDLAAALLRDYELNSRKSLETVGFRFKHLLPFFGNMPAENLETADISRYIDQRRRAGAKNATINREMAALKRMFHLACTTSPPRVRDLPVFPSRLKESVPRQGFVEDAQYSALMNLAHDTWLKGMIATAYTFGLRKSEILLHLKVGQVDLTGQTITLFAGTTKNDEARTISSTSEVSRLLRRCIAGKAEDDYVFTREDGKPVLDFRGAWRALCEAAGLGGFVRVKDEAGRVGKKWRGLLFHDLRRSAVRNMVRSGVNEGVAMRISGHKTRSVFERYNIVSQEDIVDAARKIEEGKRARMATSEANSTDTTTDTSPERLRAS